MSLVSLLVQGTRRLSRFLETEKRELAAVCVELADRIELSPPYWLISCVNVNRAELKLTNPQMSVTLSDSFILVNVP